MFIISLSKRKENHSNQAKKVIEEKKIEKMSLMPHSFFPRSNFDMSQWLKPFDLGMTTTDLFDPFDQLDQMVGMYIVAFFIFYLSSYIVSFYT